jgi:peptide deformylase
MQIYQEGEHTALRSIAKDVPKELFGTPKLQQIVDSMFDALSRESDGVAIAAPQIGIDYNIFVVSKELAGYKKEKNFVYINPKINKVSQEKKYMDEGCLSVRWLYGKVYRHSKVSLKAKDLDGNSFMRGATGLLAHIFQHETDHLFGTLFTDKAIDVHELPAEDIEKLKKQNERT